MGNYGPNPDDPSQRLMVENGHQSKKWQNFTIKMAMIQKSLLDKSLSWQYCPMCIGQIWYNFYSFLEIIFPVQGLGQNLFYIDQMSSVD